MCIGGGGAGPVLGGLNWGCGDVLADNAGGQAHGGEREYGLVVQGEVR